MSAGVIFVYSLLSEFAVEHFNVFDIGLPGTFIDLHPGEIYFFDEGFEDRPLYCLAIFRFINILASIFTIWGVSMDLKGPIFADTRNI
jgi:hypothetical protein